MRAFPSLSFTLLHYSVFLLFYMQILLLSVFFMYLLCIFLLWTDSPFVARRCVSLVLHHLYRLFYVHSFPILSLYFLMYSDTVVNRFIVGEGCSRNFNSIASYVREMIYAMHTRSRVHAHNIGTKRRGQCFASALSTLCRRHVRYFNGVDPFIFLFCYLSAYASTTSDKTIYWLEIEKRIQFHSVDSCPLWHSSKNRFHPCFTFLFLD